MTPGRTNGANVWCGTATLERLTRLQALLKADRGIDYPRTIVVAEGLAELEARLLRMTHGQSHKTDADTA